MPRFMDELENDENSEIFNYDVFMKDAESTEYQVDGDFLEQITNGLELPMLFDDSILLQDVSADEIMSAATASSSPHSLPETDISGAMSPFTTENLAFSHAFDTSDINMLMLDESAIKIENDKYCSSSHSPTPSQSSSDSFNGHDTATKFLLDTPPISPSNMVTSSPNSSHADQPFIINGNFYKLITTNGPETILQKISSPAKKSATNKRIKEIHIVNGANKLKKNLVLSGDNLSSISMREPPKIKFVKNTVQPNNHTNGKTCNIPKIPIVNTASSRTKCTTNLLYPKFVPKNDLIDLTNVQSNSIPSVGDMNTSLSLNRSSELSLNTGSSRQTDLKAYKRYQRMIKNRESACMSRKRKKDYVTSLEKQLRDLSNENLKLKSENLSLKKMLADVTTATKKTFFNLPKNASKNTAVLLAMLLMISVNVGSIGKLVSTRNTEELSPLSNPDTNLHDFQTRKILWMPADSSEVLNSTTADSINNITANSSLHICPMHINQTESVRLVSELRRWIGEPLYNWTNYNAKSVPPVKLNLTRTNGVKPTRVLKQKSKYNRFYGITRKKRADISENELQIYNFANNFYEYSDFFKSIEKQDDTFYVVSFKADQLLLPAINHNKTTRPKMSLLMPAVMTNDSFSTPNDHITLLKIDCEVTNTNLVHVRQNSIPQHLRSTLHNGTANTNSRNAKVDEKRKMVYKPYFMKDENDLDYMLREKNIRFP